MKAEFENDVESVLFDQKTLAQAVSRIAREIEAKYRNSQKPILLLGVLRGSVVFMADLMKELKLPVEVDFVRISSYGNGSVSSGKINIKSGLENSELDKYNVIVVEDILDSGNTLSYFVEYLHEKGAESVDVCVLLDKPDRRKRHVDVAFYGFTIPDEFVVGYGLDYSEKYRNLPYVGILKHEVYEK